ncbi:MAG: LPS export ABC transporter periplasmic protein LptC, partial [Gammaproteobacteria bacterium]|nr:LPS export ABC transporter periplasmic protein LptC [Gammaproteobacteria bacterium]
TTEIIQPHILFKETKGDWSISAQRAHILTNNNIVHLYNNVNITRQPTDQQDALSITTEYLKVNTDNKTAETDKLAHIATRQLELDTTGMVFDNNKGILKLLSEVKGTYETER